MLYSCLTPPLAINTRKPEGRPCNAFVRAKLSIQYIYIPYTITVASLGRTFLSERL